ncbi:MAG: UvrB/UvrC motif-containing protein [Lachnospiraceae bacterium]|nr:UvrB/UvrC motif-containing protein [Lachnospiraceae bacterium]
MLCERCGQREANVRYTEIVNGEVTEHNLCMECARTMDFGGHKYAAALFDGESQLGRLLSGLLGFAMDPAEEERGADSRSVVCPVCHTSYAEFVKESRFGCADCYEIFKLLMGDHIKTLQGSDTHSGKKPMKCRNRVHSAGKAVAANSGEGMQTQTTGAEQPVLSAQEKIAALEAHLKEALREEEYEAAARYRDAIRALKAEVSADE